MRPCMDNVALYMKDHMHYEKRLSEIGKELGVYQSENLIVLKKRGFWSFFG